MKDMNGGYSQWWQDEKWSLILTVLCPIIATTFTVLAYFKDFNFSSSSWGLTEYTNLLYAFQTFFCKHRCLLSLGTQGQDCKEVVAKGKLDSDLFQKGVSCHR